MRAPRSSLTPVRLPGGVRTRAPSGRFESRRIATGSRAGEPTCHRITAAAGRQVVNMTIVRKNKEINTFLHFPKNCGEKMTT